MNEFKVKISIVMEFSHDAEELFDLLVELRVCKNSPDVEFIDYNREIVIESFANSEEEADKIIDAYRLATHRFVYGSDIVLEEFTASNSKMLYLDGSNFNRKPKAATRDEKVALIMKNRKSWKKQDFIDSYEDEWDEMPEALEDCFEKMNEYIYNTYDDGLLDEIIEDEGLM